MAGHFGAGVSRNSDMTILIVESGKPQWTPGPHGDKAVALFPKSVNSLMGGC